MPLAGGVPGHAQAPDTTRRRFLAAGAGAGIVALAAAAPVRSTRAAAARPRVVVVGGGYGGATAARYLKRWGAGALEVVLVEAQAAFVSCPLSNLVLAGSRSLSDITQSYAGLAREGVRVVHDRAEAVDPHRRQVRLSRGDPLSYDRLVLAPGIDFFLDRIEGLASAAAQARVLHAWKAGPQTAALRDQIVAMRDGGVFAIAIPRAPFRCPPGPYERACQVAWYFQQAKPRSKVLVLDANEDVQSKKALFMRAWQETYRGIVEYRHDYQLTGVDPATMTARFEFNDDERVDVLNVIPPQGAGAIAHAAGVVTANGQWCEVDFRTFESIKVPNVHVLGDAIQVAPQMPKSGHMANQHGKVAAAAVLRALAGEAARDPVTINNTSYSFITDREAVHVASVHRYDAAQKTYVPVQGAGGLSPSMSADEGRYGFAWAQNIWADTLG
jgi:NADPH-dependent 2,4-dienoyl-CoA reductase/sulfur reductase-like enzyme